ncbi:MAG: hypothetical protein WA728_26090 [Xanthobacteraceae bacterium]
MLLTLVNGLFGALCGMSFKVQVLAPLIAVAFVETAILKHAGTWPSVFWLAVMLIVATEMGYLAGSSADALWSPSGGGSDNLDIES